MREFTMVFEDGLGKGLDPNPNGRHKDQWLREALGAMPEDEMLQSIPILPTPTTVTGSAYPYPQIFRLRRMILVCAARTIYEYVGGTLTVLFHSGVAGGTWSVADFGDYIVLTNGVVLVERNPQTGEFEVTDTCLIPKCICVLNLNGQLIVGGPGVSVSEGFTGA